ncbi:MAG: WD40/YVTN/BNR-like repeat-containing protein [Woeseiaceae bacterium]
MSQRLTIFASTWNNGLFILDDDGLVHELPNQPVRGLSHDANGGVLASVDGNGLYQRTAKGIWRLLARCDGEISVTLSLAGEIYVGTDDARVLVLDGDGNLRQIDHFDSIDGRDSWFAGTAVVDGREVGPPLGIRSLHGAADGLLFANVHVGGIPRSNNHGATWEPTIDVNLDAHQVCVDADNSSLVVAASAMGLCISDDGGDTWKVQTEGLHATYCSAVEIVGDQVFVAASDDHFASKGAIYRRTVGRQSEALVKVAGGLPDWLDGIVDTACIASRLNQMAIVTASGSVYVSDDNGNAWHKREEVVPGVSSVCIL